MNNNYIGFSQKINDPAFARYLKDTNRWSAIFSIGLSIIAVVGFFIAGETSSDLKNPESLYIGLVIGSMFLLIALFQISGRNKSTTWDGTVVEKKVEKKHRHDKYQDCWKDYLEFTVFIRDDKGKIHYISADDDDTKYNYFQKGDRVRHHKGLNSFEKQNKSRDMIIFCNACASLNDIREDNWFRCKCPLLK